MSMKKSGFTLLEILITMSVIGIIASMTIPQLVNNYQRRVYVTSLKKTHMDLEQSFARYLNDKNVNSLALTDFATNPQSFFGSYIRMNKSDSTFASTFAASYTDIEGNAASFTSATCGANGKYYLTKGGASLCVPATCNVGTCQIYIDTNGSAKPNIVGRDLFSGYIWEDGTIDVVSPAMKAVLPVSELQAYRLTAIDKPSNDPEKIQKEYEEAIKKLNEEGGKSVEKIGVDPRFIYIGKDGNSTFANLVKYNEIKDRDQQREFIRKLYEDYIKNGGRPDVEAPGGNGFGLGGGALAISTVHVEENFENALHYINDHFLVNDELRGLLDKHSEIENHYNDYSNNYQQLLDAYNEAVSQRYGTCMGNLDKSKASLTCLGAIIADDWSMNY